MPKHKRMSSPRGRTKNDPDPELLPLWENYQRDRSVENRNALMTAYWPIMLRLIKRAASRRGMFLGDKLYDIGGDMAVSVLIRAIPAYDASRGRFTTFLWRHIVQSLLRNSVKRRYIATLSQERLDEIPDERSTRVTIEEMVEGLQADEQLALLKFYRDNLTKREIATSIGGCIDSVRRLIRRAEKKLRFGF